MEYIAVIHKDTNNTYWAEFPDVPGCFSSGNTIDEVKRNAWQALFLYFSGPNFIKPIYPHESTMEEIKKNYQGEAFVRISLPLGIS